MNEKIELFVPGRLCLIGEHSDWAGRHRTMNADIVPGCAIVTGIEQGIYATVSKADDFSVTSRLPQYSESSFACEMNVDSLLKVANEGGFFSYVAGVASYVYENYSVGGLRIEVTKMDLPMKSGLSSSAAICVLVARAFNLLYNLHLSTMGEMQIAFMGEQRTPSRCGRLDQACAFGTRPVIMTFDGMDVRVRPLALKKPLFFVIADLKAGKDTVKILSDLNKCYPFPTTKLEKQVEAALGKDNAEFVENASEAIETGNVEKLGQIMYSFQDNFDKKVGPASIEQLKAPVLHSVLADEYLKSLCYGMKGVGSQGDGTVQLLAKDEDSQSKVIEYLSKKGMPAFPLTLKPKQAVTKAIIPVAGFATRLFPSSKGVKKAFMPIMDSDGLLKPAIMVLLEELYQAGIEEYCLVISEDEKADYDRFFTPVSEEHASHLSDENLAYEALIEKIGRHITYVVQKERKGFGHAVSLCRKFAGGAPVLLVLGDTIYRSEDGRSCTKQLLDAYEQYGGTMLSVQNVPVDTVSHYGMIKGIWENEDDGIISMDCMVEKPTPDYALEHLRMLTRRGESKYYAVFGQYILTGEVFEILDRNVKENKLSKGEIQLTDALIEVCGKFGMKALVPNGKSFDLGNPEAYIDTFKSFAKAYKKGEKK